MATLFQNFGVSSGLKENKLDVCDVCFWAKRTKSCFSKNKAIELFDLIHCDIWGTYREKASSGASYFLTIVNDASKATWVYPMHEKK